MRKILITLLVVIATMSILWIFAGRQISLILERFGTIEVTSEPIKSLVYESGSGNGALIINGLHFTLDPADPDARAPNIGTTKDNQFALSFGGKVFPFGPSIKASDDSGQLAAAPEAEDLATFQRRRGVLNWIIPSDLKAAPTSMWRHIYYRVVWQKKDRARLEMVWRYEQPAAKTWPLDSGVAPIHPSGLIRIDISNVSR
jgi:hypothetical protein